MRTFLLTLLIVLAATGCRRRPPRTPPTQPGTFATTQGGYAPVQGGYAPVQGGYAPAPEVPSAAEECGTDRRCRLARLRRLGRERAAARAAAATAHHEAVQSTIRKVEHDRVPRRRQPWVAENVITDHWFGAIVGVHPIQNVFVGVGASMVFGLGFHQSTSDRWISGGTNPQLALQTEIRWLMFDHNITPYLSGGFHVMLLGGMWVNAHGPGESLSANTTLDVHAVSMSLGIDVHLDFGLRFRAGATLRPLIYVRAREGDAPVPLAEEGFASAWRIFGAEGALGWAW